MKLNRTITFGAGLLAVSSIGSYGFGLLRDRLLAGQFGASAELDVYNASFLIPDFIMSLFAAALTSALVPVFIIWWHKKDKKQAWELFNHVLILLAIIILLTTGIAFLLTPWIIKIFSPGFQEYRYLLLIKTTRLMLISPLFFSMSILFGSALQGMRRFITYAISPILYNLGIVFGIIFLAPRYGIFGAIIGVLIGAFCHMLIRVIETCFTGWQLKHLKTHWDGVWKVFKLMVPRALALATWQANLWVYTALASGLAVGSVGIFNLTRNFQSLPVSLFGIAFATAMFPALASHYAKNNVDGFRNDLSKTIRQVLFFTVPACVSMIILAKPFVDHFIGTGKFDESAVASTGLMLSIFAVSVPFESVQHCLARSFYARHDTVTPVKITIAATIVNVAISYSFVQLIGLNGLAVGFICYSLTQVILLSIMLKRKISRLNTIEVFNSSIKIIGASLIMGVAIYFVDSFILSIIIGASIYLLLAVIMQMKELQGLRIILKKFI